MQSTVKLGRGMFLRGEGDIWAIAGQRGSWRIARFIPGAKLDWSHEFATFAEAEKAVDAKACC